MDREAADQIQAEVAALNESSTSSAKVLTEKFALAHELANLKPELEHLRSQLGSHQSVLSEKLSLQRQLSTVQVELETEKRAGQRILAKESKKESKNVASENKHEEQLERLRKELAKEKRDREKMERDAKEASSEWEPKVAMLEDKLEAMRGKLRSTKEKLKESQEELQQAQADAGAQTAQAERAERATKNPRKRTASHLDDAIGTPDGVAGNGRGPAAKRNKMSSTLPGDKSAFSITPFLSRTSLAPESPKEQGDPGKASEDAATAEPDASPSAARKGSKPAKARGLNETSAETNVLGTAKPARTNTKPPAGRKRSVRSTLEKVAEEEDEENRPPTFVVPSAATFQPKIQTKPMVSFSNDREASEEPEAKKKKRKLLSGGPGKTLFDDEEGDAAKPAKVALGDSKAFPSWIKGGLARSKGGVGAGLAGGGSAFGGSAFGGFSPLKKDRKAVTGR